MIAETKNHECRYAFCALFRQMQGRGDCGKKDKIVKEGKGNGKG